MGFKCTKCRKITNLLCVKIPFENISKKNYIYCFLNDIAMQNKILRNCQKTVNLHESNFMEFFFDVQSFSAVSLSL